jgi:hypothetical protein
VKVLRPLQTASEDLRSRRKALELARSVCREAPQARLTVASTPGLLSNLASSLQHQDLLMVGSSLGLLHELVDDQQALAVVKSDAQLCSAVQQTQDRLQRTTGEDRDAVLEELEMLTVITDHLG